MKRTIWIVSVLAWAACSGWSYGHLKAKWLAVPPAYAECINVYERTSDTTATVTRGDAVTATCFARSRVWTRGDQFGAVVAAVVGGPGIAVYEWTNRAKNAVVYWDGWDKPASW